MAHILGIGIATLDIINNLDGYPAEDAEVRAISQRVCRGGNATNSLTVLSAAHQCSWAGVWVDEPDGQQIRAALQAADIDMRYCRVLQQGKMPTSYINLNQRNGSRTIVHYRDLPEFSFTDFQHINLNEFDWLHFEGRNIPETQKMLRHAKQQQPHLPISLEIEKPRKAIESLYSLPDVLLFSRHFAQQQGYDEGADFLHIMRSQAPQADLYCAWGEAGAYALAHEQSAKLHAPSYPPTSIIDTLGAGDTFNAAVIHGYLQQQSPNAILHQACRLAGEKCGQLGLDNLKLWGADCA